MNTASRILLATALSLALGACAKKVKEAPEPAPAPAPAPAVTRPADDGRFGPEDLETNACLRQRVVYFEFDKSDIQPAFHDIMRCHAKYLNDRSGARVTLEGHADERGTREYNLGLGERRGNSVRDALMANGASAGQLNVVSYGEERPVCTESTEACWSQNRRVEIIYTAK